MFNISNIFSVEIFSIYVRNYFDVKADNQNNKEINFI